MATFINREQSFTVHRRVQQVGTDNIFFCSMKILQNYLKKCVSLVYLHELLNLIIGLTFLVSFHID